MQHVGKPTPVLRQDVIVQPQLFPHLLATVFRSVIAQQDTYRIAGCDLHEHEDSCTHQYEHRNGCEQPSHDITGHSRPPPSCRRAFRWQLFPAAERHPAANSQGAVIPPYYSIPRFQKKKSGMFWNPTTLAPDARKPKLSPTLTYGISSQKTSLY